jgi:hypothetical protein
MLLTVEVWFSAAWVRLLNLTGWLWREKLTGGVATLEPCKRARTEFIYYYLQFQRACEKLE